MVPVDAIEAGFPGSRTKVTFQTALGARRVDILTSAGDLPRPEPRVTSGAPPGKEFLISGGQRSACIEWQDEYH